MKASIETKPQLEGMAQQEDSPSKEKGTVPLRSPAPHDKLKLAVIGCGAIAKLQHLPAINRCTRVEAAVLVDQSLDRARQLAQRYSVPQVAGGYKEIRGLADAAIIALPNYLHAPVAIDLLEQGIHVLVEKPMAFKAEDCKAMIEAARSAGATLAVGMEFRFFQASQFMKQLVEAGLLGTIRSFDLRMGLIFSWPMESDYLFNKETAGGGVLIDFGVHVLDLLLWWLGDYAEASYFDDAAGGVEANCELRLRLANGACGTVELSRIRHLRNTCIISGERGEVEIELWNADPAIRLKLNNGAAVFSGRISQAPGVRTVEGAFGHEIEDFAEAICNGRAPRVTGEEAAKAIQLIEACYASRHRLRHPWSF